MSKPAPRLTVEQERVTRHVSRTLEDWGLIIAFTLGLLYGVSEIIVHAVVSLGFRPHTPAPFPWIIVLFFLGCILPKTLGRATTGQVWVALAHGVAKLLPGNGRKDKESPARPDDE